MKRYYCFVALLFIFLNTYSIAQIPTDGLVAYYPFAGNANDESGNGNNGTTNGGISWGTDRFDKPGNACFLNGTDAYISAPNSSTLNITGPISI